MTRHESASCGPAVKKLATAALLAATLASVNAAPMLRLVADAQPVRPGDMLDIGVFVDGLGTGTPGTRLGAFDLSLVYSLPGAVPGTPSVSFGSGLGDAADPAQTLTGVDTSVGGLLRLFEVSLLEASAAGCVACTGPYLDALQAGSMHLATLHFGIDPAAVGSVSLLLDAVLLADAAGNVIADAGVSVGQVTVPVPEPVGLAWLALLGAVLATRLPRRAAPHSG